MKFNTLLIVAASLSAVSVVNAQNFVQDYATGNAAWGDIHVFNIQDDLMLDQAYNIDQVTLFETWGDGTTYTLNIYDDYIDQGGNLLASYGFDTGASGFDGNGIFNAVFDTSGLVLGPGTFILHFYAENADNPSFDYFWFNSNLGAPNGNEAYVDGLGFSSAWSGESFDMSWNIDATAVVPEPASMAALGLGLIAVARRRRK